MALVRPQLLKAGLATLLLAVPGLSSPVLGVYSQAEGVPCVNGSWGFCTIFPGVSSATGPIEGAGTSSGENGTLYLAGRANYGSLGVLARSTGTTSTVVSGAALAYMQDTWLVSGGTPGAASTIQIMVSLNADYGFNWSANLGAYVPTDWPGGSPYKAVEFICRIDNGCHPDAGGTYSATATFDQAIQFDTPFNVILGLVGWVGARNGASQYVDAWGSATITGVRVLDSSGQPVQGFSLTADSGHDYLAADGDVPEPGTCGLLALAAAVLVLRRRGYWRGRP